MFPSLLETRSREKTISLERVQIVAEVSRGTEREWKVPGYPRFPEHVTEYILRMPWVFPPCKKLYKTESKSTSIDTRIFSITLGIVVFAPRSPRINSYQFHPFLSLAPGNAAKITAFLALKSRKGLNRD